MKINWNYFIKQKGVILAGLVVCLVILGSANYIYTKNKNKTDPNDQQPQETYFQASTTQAPDPQTTPNPDSNVDNTDGDDDIPTTQTDYFESYRTNRQSIRDMEMKYVQTLSESASSDADVKKEAEARLLEISRLMELELKVENLIKAKGFEDVVAFVEDGSINVVVKAESISASDAAKILKIVTEETKESAQNITIITRT